MRAAFIAAVLMAVSGCGLKLRKDVQAGLPESLAIRRSHSVSEVRYALRLDIGEEISGEVTLRFHLADAKENVVLDFKAPEKYIVAVSTPYRFREGHIAFRGRRGENEITVKFRSPASSVHRGDKYAYTLFVPERASETFPCFDQPDIKGRLSLTLTVPPDWTAVSNGAQSRRVNVAEGVRFVFNETRPLPTYLFAFAAGTFKGLEGMRNGRRYTMHYLEDDQEKVDRNAPAVLDAHAEALAWLSSYTGIEYPFEKFDFVLLPGFPFSGMEHPGAVFYRDEAVLLGEKPTEEERLNRALLIAHESAHMWFGGLVTMSWFDDVWTKESFANFMADKIIAPSFPNINFDLRFIAQHAQRAYAVDRSKGANPLYQPLGNLSGAAELYGDIVYHKSPFVLRQLESLMGKTAFRDGLRRHLRRHAYGNATWAELVTLLDPETPSDLPAFSRAWVGAPGRSRISQEVILRDGKIEELILTQENGDRPQKLMVRAGSAPAIPVTLSGARTVVAAARGLSAPDFVFSNASGEGYGYFKLDPASLEFVLKNIGALPDPALRASLWESLYDAAVMGDLAPESFVRSAANALKIETDELIADTLLGRRGKLIDIFWNHLDPAERSALAPELERTLTARLTQKASSLRTTLMKGFRGLVFTPGGIRRLEYFWRTELAPEKILAFHLPEYERVDTALRLAVLNPERAEIILKDQESLIADSEQKKRFAFLRAAASASPETRALFLKNLKNPKNRKMEPWVIDGLKLLFHPLRREASSHLLESALNMLKDVRETGDIFFPQLWASAVLSHQNTPSALKSFKRVLSKKGLPLGIRRLLLQSGDTLLRCAARSP